MASFFCPWAAIAAAVYALWPVVHGLLRPVVASLQFFPALFRFGLRRWQQLPTVGGFVFCLSILLLHLLSK
jgi:hypothetical protein